MTVRFVTTFAVFVVGVGATATAASPHSHPMTAAQPACATTVPNGKPPGRVEDSQIWARHGNRAIGAILRRDGTLVTNAQGGYKMLWYARGGLRARLVVHYWRVDDPSHVFVGRGGYFEGYYSSALNGTMNQQFFTPGCWRITGRVRSVRLSFVVEVLRGDS